jgi:hypothetical protein
VPKGTPALPININIQPAIPAINFEHPWFMNIHIYENYLNIS